MPIDVTCPDCSENYKVPDDVAGKKIRCPKCKVAVIQVAAAASSGGADSATLGNAAGADAAAVGTAGMSAASSQAAADTKGQWQLKTETGDIYGPVDKLELDQWVAEGRVNAQTQLLKSGETQWQWASTIFPHLANAGANPAAMQSPVVSHGQPYQHQYTTANPHAANPTPVLGARPGQAQAISILLTIGGIWAMGFAALILLSSVCIIFTAFYSLIAGILALVFGIQSFSSNVGMGGKLKTASIMLIVCIIGCDLVAMGVGIASLILLSDQRTAQYFR